MVIDVRQCTSEKKNEFEIVYDKEIKYKAELPFIMVLGNFDLERLREIKVYDINNDLIYRTNYDYIDNAIEELVPLKYLITNSQKFHQLKFINEKTKNDISICFEMKEIWNGYNLIKYQNIIYKCYSVEDGYIRHICIYKDDIQIAELLKPNIVIDGKDEYRIYIKDEYSYLSDSLSLLALYLDRTEYNSSYLKNESKEFSKKYSYSKANKYYNPNWVISNFDSNEYFIKIKQGFDNTKKEVINKFKKLIAIFGVVWGTLAIIAIILLIILL